VADVEKLDLSKLVKKNSGPGSSTNDVNFLGILHPLNFGGLAGNWSFSTATPVNVSHPVAAPKK
jgi:hypothetical protein